MRILSVGAAAMLAFVVPGVSHAAECPSAEPQIYDPGGAPRTTGPVNDPLFDKQWGLQQIKAPAAWARGFTGAGVTIAIIDTGVDLHHPDLVDRLVPGVDLVEGIEDNCAPGPQDDAGHGTHVAGIAAATADNGIGGSGVAPHADLMPLKVFAGGSAPWSAVVRAIRTAADRGADVINMSFGGSLPGPLSRSQSIESAIQYAWGKGAVLVASAGNSTLPFCGSPANKPHVICAAATDRLGLPAEYSNFPTDVGKIDAFRAPGGNQISAAWYWPEYPPLEGLCDTGIWSTHWPGGFQVCGAAYDVYAGTSMASPHVAGVAAMLVQAGLTNQQTVERLKATATNEGRYDPVMGYGIVDADAATAGLAPLT